MYCIYGALETQQFLQRQIWQHYRGITAKLHISSIVKPHFYHPRSIAYALRSRVDQLLEKLVCEGIVVADKFAKWATPIVPVVKRDGSVRICGDYKLKVNQIAQVDTYSLPLVQDILASLANGNSFTKLDLAPAYQQLSLNNDSHSYTTRNTHQGLFHYTCLPVSMAVAPAIFQCTMESLLEELPKCLHIPR